MGEQIQLQYDGEPGRLDAWLASRIEKLSRSRIQALMSDGAVVSNDIPLTAKSKLHQGDLILVNLPDPAPAEPIPEDIPLDILYEDDSIVVINKPAGMVVHPAPGHESETLVNALLYHCNDLKGVGGVARPGIVHRLDMDTTGILVVAKDEESLNALSNQFQSRTTEKTYYALVHGHPSAIAGTINGQIGRHPTDRKKMTFNPPKGGKDALTHWKVEKRLTNTTLLRVKIETGRTHQIRVHLSHDKMPIVGDQVYGNRQLDRKIRDCPTRQMLHAAEFSFDHPKTGKRITFKAPLPKDFQELLNHA